MIELQEHQAPVDDYWETPNAPAWRSVQNHKPIIRCNCGLWVGLGNHAVHADGIVTASFYHLKSEKDPTGCGWHVNIRLAGWSGGEWPVG